MISLITAAFGIFGSWVQGRAERARLKEERETLIEVKRNEVIANAQAAEIQWDIIMAQGSQTSWKDEFWTIIIAIPLVLVFIPGSSEYVERGFITLDTVVPDWYIAVVGAAVAAAFGFRKLTDIIKRR